MFRVLAVIALLASCKEAEVQVLPSNPSSDYGHTKLLDGVAKFVAAGKTPAAYADLAHLVQTLRPGMDKAVAADAELRMLALALPPVQSVKDQPIEARVTALGTSVWPILLGPKIESDAILSVPDAKAPQYIVQPNEDANSYITRLCGAALNADCKRVVPELQGWAVEAIATRRATERIRNAITECLECTGEHADPAWAQSIAAWEALDRAAADHLPAVLRAGDPDNWPVAGNAADDDPALPEAEFTPRGDIVVTGHAYGPNEQRVAVLRDLRGNSDALALHIYPDTRLQEVRAILADARKAGVAQVYVIAREGVYPWRRKAYRVADGSGMRVQLRPTDTLQLLLHAIDEVAGPGTVARVD